VLQLGAGVTHMISHSASHPSSLVVSVIPDIAIPTPLPPCPSLRSQPCRAYVPETNTVFERRGGTRARGRSSAVPG
jgi:hypothetical protein